MRFEIRRARIPIDFFVVATLFFVGAIGAAPWVVGAADDYFYQMPVLALVHALALGWITAAIMGVMYRYVPALTHGTLPYPRLLMPQLVLYVVGASGMVSHFALRSWSGVWSAALVVLLSVALFAANMFPLLWRQLGHGAAETGMFLALCFLLIAATLGFLLALDKSHGWLGGSVISNLASHAHLAAVGWVTLTICSVSYRVVPALALPRIVLPKSAAWQLYGLAAGVIGLATTLLARAPGAALWSAAIGIALVWYIVTIARLVWTHRKPIDWSLHHAIAGIAWLLTAIALGITLAVIGGESAVGARIASSYGAIGILGWAGNLVIGVSYYLLPGFVTRVRSIHQWRALTNTDLSMVRPRASVFAGFNCGLILLVAGFLTTEVTLCVIAATIIAAAGLLYSTITMWTLGFAYRTAKA
jgi:hypothetical protein